MMTILKKKFKLTKNQKGMTLIELMAVVVILGILAAVAGTAVTGGFSNAKSKSDAANKAILRDAAQRYVLDGGSTSVANVASALVSSGYIDAVPSNPTGGAAYTVAITGGVVSVSP